MGKYILRDDELYHYGVLGMKWGVRRYQNKDGSLTAAGYKRNRKRIDKQDVDKLQRDDKFISEVKKLKKVRDEFEKAHDEYENERMKFMKNPYGQKRSVYEIMTENQDTLRSWYENESGKERTYWKNQAVNAMHAAAHDHSHLYMQTCRSELAVRKSEALVKYQKAVEDSAKSYLGNYASRIGPNHNYRNTVEKFIDNNSVTLDRKISMYTNQDPDDDDFPGR